jgi:hypothetical protein
LLGIASAASLRSESHGTHEHILLSLFLRLPQPGGPGPCIYIPQEQGGPVIPPGIWFTSAHFNGVLYKSRLSCRMYVYLLAIARQRLNKNITETTNKHATVEQSDASFSMRFLSYQRKVDNFFP